MKPDHQLFSTVRAVRSAVLAACVYLCALLTAGLLLAFWVMCFSKRAPFNMGTAFRKASVIKGTIGILPNIINTLYLIVFTLLVALPLGVGAAIYLTEYATNRKLISVVEFACETLAGLPSILYALSACCFFAQMLGFQTSLLAGGCTMVVMILPTIIRTTQESLKTVPEGYRHGSLSLGSGKWHDPHGGFAAPWTASFPAVFCRWDVFWVKAPPCCLPQAWERSSLPISFPPSK